MTSDAQMLADPAIATNATVEVSAASVWFGPKVALSELTCSFGPGVSGLLGPNGAGKTTLMRAITGMIAVSEGTVRVNGLDPRRDRSVHGSMALVPEDEAVPTGLTARQLVRYVATCEGSPTETRPNSRCRLLTCSTSPTGRSTPSARGCDSAPRSPPRSSPSPMFSCSMSR